ncbi:MAG: c-type cytochrome [Oligoflexus sp.]
MKLNAQVRSLVALSTIASMSMWSCSSSKQSDTTKTQPAVSENVDQNPKNPQPDQESPAEEKLNISEIVAQMEWESFAFNNETGSVYTGFDGENEFLVAVGTVALGLLEDFEQYSEEQLDEIYESQEYADALAAKVATLAVEVDSNFFEIVEEAAFEEGKGYILRTLAAGSTSITLKFGETSSSLTAEIAAYTPEQLAAGAERYNNAVAGDTPSPSCASCHAAENGVDHSPYFMAQFTDAGILSTIETGINSDDDYQTSAPHQMTFSSEEQKNGIVAYLRSLDPTE